MIIMVDPVQLPKSDPAELKRLDDEFLAEFAAGTIPTIVVPEIDPTTDPSGRAYSWLNPPSHPYEVAFDKLIVMKPDAWYQLAGDELRQVALSGSTGNRSDKDLYRKWATENFATVCTAAGEDGVELLEMLKSQGGGLNRDVVYQIATMLEAEPTYSNLTSEQRVIAALIAIKNTNS
jgi:hypothetical protein